jgi:4-carboxymuconolactone decarboxylase
MTARLRPLLPQELNSAQRALHSSITGGERTTGTQHFPLADDDGSLHGPFGAMLYAPAVGAALEQLGVALRFGTDLPARCREIIILQVAHALDSPFEAWAHERVGRAVGLTEKELAALRDGTFRADDPVEHAASTFCALLLSADEVSDHAFADASSVLSNQQLVELTVLVGYYRTLAQLLSTFAIGPPTAEC